jgi:hypothetical protein
MKINADSVGALVKLADKAPINQIKNLSNADRKLLALSCDAFQSHSFEKLKNQENNLDTLQDKLQKNAKLEVRHSNLFLSFFRFLGNILHLRISSAELQQKISHTKAAIMTREERVTKEYDLVKHQILHQINRAKEIEDIHSIKFFIHIDGGDKKYDKDYIIRKLNEPLNKNYLLLMIEDLLYQAKNSIGISTAPDTQFKWNAFIKDREGHFSHAHGFNEGLRYNTGIRESVDANEAIAYFNSILAQMDKEIKPQLDENQEFI